MDRMEIKLLALCFCLLVIASRLPGIFWPEKLKRFLYNYRSLKSIATRAIGLLLLFLGGSIFLILFKTITLAQLVVFVGSAVLLGAGILHLYPESLHNLISKIDGRSPAVIRVFSVLSISIAIAIGIYVALRN